MENQNFKRLCAELTAFHIPRWQELPEFDLYMDQVIALAEKYLSPLTVDGKELLTPSMINNYVKSGVLPPPKNKKYNRIHLAILMILCITKPVMEIGAISEIVHHGMEADSIENLLDGFAGIFEAELATAAHEADKAADEADTEDIFSFIAIEQIMKANASRVVAMHSYRTVKKPEPAEEGKSDKAERKAEKKKAKKEAEIAVPEENAEENA